ncbi:MAG: ATP-dependent Clp protease proteolytic subunit [Alphaproteobacteria bacterium]|nr:ATP-dependent Clp protease proteolytic subunit [Alphaproteobacteria bacterium]
MTVQRVPVAGSNRYALLLQGHIVAGDAARLSELLRGANFVALLLNSPGGSVLEARAMAGAIRALHVPVVVPAHAVCASACFMLFAAAHDKVAQPGARIGVHSASASGGNETLSTLGVTTLMAREAARDGVPAVITGRMVTTAPGEVAWLTSGELQQMGVRIPPTRAAAAGATAPAMAAPVGGIVGSVAARPVTRDFAKTVAAGTTLRLIFSYNVNPDCSSAGLSTVRVTEQPMHGTAHAEKVKDFPSFPPSNIRWDCNEARVPGVALLYTPAPGFSGSDYLTFETISVEGVDREFRVSLTVK